jgi:phosphoenolpyruvate carboxykinase (GTP)
MPIQLTAPRGNDSLAAWVSQAVSLREPDDVHWCDGSDEEFDRLCELLVESGTLERLSEERRPNSFPERFVSRSAR